MSPRRLLLLVSFALLFAGGAVVAVTIHAPLSHLRLSRNLRS